ncbi:hypothetical protein IQ269_09420 [Tychonema sp. LEGE 07199]|uniref:hypothetical protein n=1 Tax=unclassified Tychonema TaxID=2642144 RepID=UPI00188267CA|nr:MULTISPECIES: hypothetical protein [unclassified Tychonema]MBE9121034.1 hypothetical protein [Tychonema sp. LEGE 07199]MBE9133248.1 hypothetical protein [Tychonema sp. LEGE 07196]
MTRFIHDQFAKQYLKELLTPLGKVETSRDIAGEVRQIDVFFAPKPEPEVEPTTLGILGQIAAKTAVLEPFRSPVQTGEIRSCLGKLFDVHAEYERVAARDNSRIAEADLPQLWILSPTVSDVMLAGFGAIPEPENWVNGVYFLSPSLKAAIIAIHQLPRTPETLWLRILGKGNVQKQALAELRELPSDNFFRLSALELLYNLRTILEVRQDIDREDRELIMELSPLYLQRLEDATQRGIQQGIQEGIQEGIQQGIQEGIQEGIQRSQRLIVESMLQVKFGEIDEELAQIIEPLIKLESLDRARLIRQLERPQLLARFQPKNQTES